MDADAGGGDEDEKLADSAAAAYAYLTPRAADATDCNARAAAMPPCATRASVLVVGYERALLRELAPVVCGRFSSRALTPSQNREAAHD